MKKFFKKTEGFTLVELIVVIAILGILAGVGTVGYSGYIKKANMAADQVLLDSLNTAFAAACIENGEPHTGVTASDINITVDTAVGDDILVVTAPADKKDAIMASFGTYFAEGGKFKVMTSLIYNSSTGMFTPGDEVDSALIEAMRPVAESIKQKLSGSSYEGSEASIINNIQSLTNTAEAITSALGASNLGALLGGGFGDYLADNGVDTANSQAVANHATLFVADQVSGLTDAQKAEIARLWQNNDFYYGNVMDGVMQFAGPETGLSAMGAMAVFYANAEACVQNMSKNYNPADEAAKAEKQAVIDAFNNVSASLSTATDVSTAWTALASSYENMMAACGDNDELASALMGYGAGNGTTDANAFLEAMGIINDNASALKDMADSDNMYGNLSSAFN